MIAEVEECATMVESQAGRSRHREIPGGDEALIAALADDGFAGPKYLLVALRLADRGFDEMAIRIRSGRIFRDCVEVGRPVSRSELLVRATSSWEVSRELASTTVTVALPFFWKSALVEGGWLPTGGSSVKRYFIGSCVLVFPNVYRKWCKEFWRYRREVRYGLVPEDAILRGVAWDPVEEMVSVAPFRDLVADLPWETVHALKLIAFEGLSQRDAAERCGLTVNALQKRLKCLREAWRRAERESR
ncbi:hypothetical protein [Lentzea sp. E54]|uniref:hypothetical protein n=1 Tax=Lentzea xerophila TaxID=3435883 RepID=UPI003DA2F6CA